MNKTIISGMIFVIAWGTVIAYFITKLLREQSDISKKIIVVFQHPILLIKKVRSFL